MHDGSYPSEPSTSTASTQATMETCIGQGVGNTTESQDIIDVDEIEEIEIVEGQGKRRAVQDVHKPAKQPRKWPCEGISLAFPEGANHHTSYPFGIHSERSIPWDYRSIDDAFYLQAKSCQKTSYTEGGVCGNCQKLTSSALFVGIKDRIQHGTHENVALMYHGVGALITIARRKTDQIEQLRMSKLNDSRKLLVKAGALEDHKQWVLAVASGRVERVASLVQAGLKQRVGVKTLIQQYNHATEKLYKPKGYTQEDIMRSIVLLRLGGARVAQFAHQSLALPSLTTIRRQTVLPALVVSPSTPTVAEVEANIISCYSSFDPVSGAFSGRTALDPLDSDLWRPNQIVHQVLMLDELAIEKRARWDDLHNKFQGTCREHNQRIPLDFTSERELDLLCEAIENDEVHLATEVRVLCSTRPTSDSLILLDSQRQRWPLLVFSRPSLVSMLCDRFASPGPARRKPASNMPGSSKRSSRHVTEDRNETMRHTVLCASRLTVKQSAETRSLFKL
jgi:hypothetical protein